MRSRLFTLVAILTFAELHLVPLSAQQNASGIAGAFGTIEGLVTREGTSDPIPGVQITVNGRSNTLADRIGFGMSPQQIQAMAQSILDTASRGTAVPSEILQAAQEAVRDGASDGRAVAAPLSAVSDSGGHFSIKDVPVGNASLRAQLKGYFAPAANGGYPSVVTMSTEVTARDAASVHLRMVPGGTISGRVLDPAGKPLAGIPVQVLRPGYDKGILSPQLQDLKTTDDRGEYRSYGLPPGTYYIVASPPRTTAGGPRGNGGSSSPREIPVPTLYPNGLDVAAALPVALRGGDEMSGIHIQMRMTTGVKLSGRVISALPPGPVTGPRGQARPSTANVTLMQRDTVGLPDINGGGVVVLNAGGGVTAKQDDGSFEIVDVPPGAYDLFARLPVAASTGWGTANPPAIATTPWALGRISVDVRNADVENISIVVRPGVDLKGRVVVDGRPFAGDVRISLEPDDSAVNINDGPSSLVYGQISQYHPPVAVDGSFVFPLLPEGLYRFQVSFGAAAGAAGGPGGQSAGRPAPPAATPLPDTAYVADIRQGGVSIYDSGIVIDGAPPNSIDVIVNTRGGSIQGTVAGPDEKPAAGMTVVLVPSREHRLNPERYKTVTSDASGHFAISRIPPGQYMLFASQSIQSGAFQNAEFLAKYTGRGSSVNVSDGLQTNAVIRAVPND